MKTVFIKLSSLLTVILIFAFSSSAFAQSTAAKLDINKIISAQNSAAAKDRQADQARESRFKSERNKQQGRLSSMVNERNRQERISNELDAQYKANTVKIEELKIQLAKELGDLKELYGFIQQTASESQESFKTSLISSQFPDRADKVQKMVAKMASLTDLVSIDELEDLWFELMNEMNQQGKIVTFPSTLNYRVTEEDENGEEKTRLEKEESARNVTRLGVFTAVSDDDVVRYENGIGLVKLNRSMNSDFISKSKNFQNQQSGIASFPLDPNKGGLLALLVTKKTLLEKVNQGGYVGYLIITLGVIALIIALLKILALTSIESKVKRQANDIKRPSLRNPLGRLLKVYYDNSKTDSETMELKLGESIAKESPKLNSWVMFIKIIAVVAPLLGLLGTVTGMIQTFQAITLYGAGDPQTMAGGISQALVTTVLGLVVAIPTVFLHWLASGRAKRIEATLEETANGLVAKHFEKNS